MREAGYSKGADGSYSKDGRRLELTIATYDEPTIPGYKEVLLWAADQYRRFGIVVTTRFVPSVEFGRQISTGEHSYDGIIDFWGGGPDPDMGRYTEIWHSASSAARGERTNLIGDTNPALDRAIEAGRGPDCSRASRQRAYTEFNRILNEEQPYTFLFAGGLTVVASAELRGIVASPAERQRWWPNVHLWWFAKGGGAP